MKCYELKNVRSHYLKQWLASANSNHFQEFMKFLSFKWLRLKKLKKLRVFNHQSFLKIWVAYFSCLLCQTRKTNFSLNYDGFNRTKLSKGEVRFFNVHLTLLNKVYSVLVIFFENFSHGKKHPFPDVFLLALQ